MYSYYALRAMGHKPPRFISMVITLMQLTQMIVGCTINLWAYDYLQTMHPSACHISPINIKLSIAMYFSYFVLFAQFFYITYLSPNARKGKRTFSKGDDSILEKQQTPTATHLSTKTTTASLLTNGSRMATTNGKSDKFKEQ